MVDQVIGWQNTSKGKVLGIYRRGCFMVFLSDHRNLIGVIRLDSATAAAQRDRTGQDMQIVIGQRDTTFSEVDDFRVVHVKGWE